MVRHKSAKGSTRPQRFEIQAPLRYRMRGERTWHEGTTLNISKSGVLFRGDTELARGANIEMTFTLPVKTNGDTGAKVSCHGVIVRSSDYPFLAAKICGSRMRPT